MTRPIITLTTDFGESDGYVAAMKGVILSGAPEAQIVDLSHDVRPQDVLGAAFLFAAVWRNFPPGTVHVVVVDPGVGTSRRRVAFSAEGQVFIGPDNGCLSGALPEADRGSRDASGYEARPLALPLEVVAVSIENKTLLRRPVSATFEGRDVFAPAAAFLARASLLTDLGPRIDALNALPAFRAPRTARGLEGLVLRVDRFGNLITDIRASDLPGNPVVKIAGRRLAVVRTYADGTGPTALIGSSGYLEVAMPEGDAAALLSVGPGEPVIVTEAAKDRS